MKKEEIDRLIEKSLTAEEAEFYYKLDEQNIFEMFGGLLQGKMKWLTILTFVVQLIMLVCAFYLGYRFFNTTDLAEMIRFGSGTVLLMIAVGTMKVFHLMEMNKNATIREIKRIELQLSALATRLKQN